MRPLIISFLFGMISPFAEKVVKLAGKLGLERSSITLHILNFVGVVVCGAF